MQSIDISTTNYQVKHPRTQIDLEGRCTEFDSVRGFQVPNFLRTLFPPIHMQEVLFAIQWMLHKF